MSGRTNGPTDAVLGIDIGGSGIKGNLVDPLSGTLLSHRLKIATPQPASPDAVAEVVAEMVRHFAPAGTVGCTFPAIVKRGTVWSAANVDPSWVGTDAAELFESATERPFRVVNDADAAGVAEMRFGAGVGRSGVVLLLTFGTGIGSALFVDGVLVPNTELGHVELDGHAPVEDWAAANVRKDDGLSWKKWARRVDAYLTHLTRLFSPDLYIVGGGVSRKWPRYAEYLRVEVETRPAELENEAGIVGAAMCAFGA